MFVDVNVKIAVVPVIVISSGCADQKKKTDSKAVDMIAMTCLDIKVLSYMGLCCDDEETTINLHHLSGNSTPVLCKYQIS